MAADGGRMFERTGRKKEKKELSYGEKNFNALALTVLKKKLGRNLSAEETKRFEAFLQDYDKEYKEQGMQEVNIQDLSKVDAVIAAFESAPTTQPAAPAQRGQTVPKQKQQASREAKPQQPPAKPAWTPREQKQNLAAAVGQHEARRADGNPIQGRLLALTEQVRKAKKPKEREALITQIEAIVSDNPRALEQELAGVPGVADIALLGERIAARTTSEEERVSLIQHIAEFADAAKKEKRLSDQEIIRLISSRIEHSLAQKDAGLISALNPNELRSLSNEAGLLVSGTAVAGVELMTAGAYISLVAQGMMHATIVYTSPAGIAFNAACVLAAAGVLPLTELAKSLNFHEKAARAAWYDELQKINGKDEAPKRRRGISARAAAAALMATGAGAATEVATNIAPKVITIVAAQGPNMLSTAAALRQGHEAESFVAETNAALAQANEQVSLVLRDYRPEGYTNAEALPPMVRDYHAQLEAFGDHMIRTELGGSRSEASGGSGVAGVGPSSLRKMALFEGWFPGNYVEHDDPRLRALGPAAQAWAFEQRGRFSYAQVDAEGNPVMVRNSEGVEVQGRVPIEFLTRQDGSQESIPDWVERRYQAFEVQAQDRLVRFGQERQDLGELSAYLADRLIPWNVKLDLMRARIQSTEGFTNDTEAILETLLEIEGLFRTEFTVPVQGMNESLIASLRQVGSGDEGMRIDAPELAMDLSLLENLEAPHSLTFDDLVKPEQVARLFMERNLSGQLLFSLLFGSIFFQQLWKYNAGKGRARKMARVLSPRMKKMFGEQYQEGDEYAIASSMSADVGETLKTFLVGEGTGVLETGSLKKVIPFEGRGSWLQLDPEFVLFSMRLAGERSGEFPVATSANPLTWLQSFGSAYKKGMAEFLHGASTVPEAKTYMNMEERYRDRTALTKETFGEMLPGFTDVVFIARQLNELQMQGRREQDPEVQELSTRFKNAYADMVFSHLTARACYTRTKIDYYRKAYEDLKKNGKFEDVGVERLSNLPNLSIPFGDTSVDLSEDDIAKLDMVRKTGLRTTVIAEIERELKREEGVLESIDRFVEDIEKNESERVASLSVSFVDRLDELKGVLDRSRPVEIKGDRMIADMSARGGLNRMIREQLQEEIKVQIRVHKEREKSETAKPRVYPIQAQYEAINQMLQYTVHDSPGQEGSLFINDRILNRFTCRPTLVHRAQGYNGAIAEYYAIEFLVTENGKNDPVFRQDLPIQTLFAEGLSPDMAARQVQEWIASMRNKASMAAKLYALESDLEEKRENVELPEAIPLTGSGASQNLKQLFTTLIPKARIQEALAESAQSLEGVEKRFEQLGDLTNLRRAKSNKEKEQRRRQRSRQKQTYESLFESLREEERILALIERDRKNLRPVAEAESRRAEALIKFLADPDNERFLSQAKIGFEYLPDVSSRYNNIRLKDRRLTTRLGNRGSAKVIEMNLNDVLNTLLNPALRTDAQRKKALIDLFTEEGRPAEGLRGNDRPDERRAA